MIKHGKKIIVNVWTSLGLCGLYIQTLYMMHCFTANRQAMKQKARQDLVKPHLVADQIARSHTGRF
jgi:hypothetical protein